MIYFFVNNFLKAWRARNPDLFFNPLIFYAKCFLVSGALTDDNSQKSAYFIQSIADKDSSETEESKNALNIKDYPDGVPRGGPEGKS